MRDSTIRISVRKGDIRYEDGAWTVIYSCCVPTTGRPVMTKKWDRFRSYALALNSYREHDRKVREYAQAHA